MLNNSLFSHKKDDWSTPSFIYDFFISCGFFDPCPFESCNFDGLFIKWEEKVFCNPPYSMISEWVEKALIESDDSFIIMLLPARTDTKWFRRLYDFGSGFVFLTGRLKFGDSKHTAPFPSMFVIVDGLKSRFSCCDCNDKLLEAILNG